MSFVLCSLGGGAMTQAPDRDDASSATPYSAGMVPLVTPHSHRTTTTGRRRARGFRVAFAVALCLLALAYLGNAAWSLSHLRHIDPGSVFAAATLPFMLTAVDIPRWSELASVGAFLLICMLCVWA